MLATDRRAIGGRCSYPGRSNLENRGGFVTAGRGCSPAGLEELRLRLRPAGEQPRRTHTRRTHTGVAAQRRPPEPETKDLGILEGCQPARPRAKRARAGTPSGGAASFVAVPGGLRCASTPGYFLAALRAARRCEPRTVSVWRFLFRSCARRKLKPSTSQYNHSAPTEKGLSLHTTQNVTFRSKEITICWAFYSLLHENFLKTSASCESSANEREENPSGF